VHDVAEVVAYLDVRRAALMDDALRWLAPDA